MEKGEGVRRSRRPNRPRRRGAWDAAVARCSGAETSADAGAAEHNSPHKAPPKTPGRLVPRAALKHGTAVQVLPPIRWGPPLVAVAVAISATTSWGVWREFDSQLSKASARLQALAELRTTQVEDWVGRQMSQARFLASSDPLADLYLRWTTRGDEEAGRRLQERV